MNPQDFTAPDHKLTILTGDAQTRLQELPTHSAACTITSPPYWKCRDYGHPQQLGQEPTPEEWCHNLLQVFKEVKRILHPHGTLWIVVGDAYAGSGRGPATAHIQRKYTQGHSAQPTPHTPTHKPKDLIGLPWMLATALKQDGWYLRADVIWHKPNPFPESVKDRPTKAHEHILMLAKHKHYYFNHDPLRTPLAPDTIPRLHRRYKIQPHAYDQPRTPRNAMKIHHNGAQSRDVWTIPVGQSRNAQHIAPFPIQIPLAIIQAATPIDGTCTQCYDLLPCKCNKPRQPALILDPFLGSGTTALAALQLQRRAAGVELNPHYAQLALQRLQTLLIPQLPL